MSKRQAAEGNSLRAKICCFVCLLNTTPSVYKSIYAVARLLFCVFMRYIEIQTRLQ